MNYLVIYYTRTNTTKKVAEYIAVKLGAKLEEIIDLKDRSGVKGYLLAGRDALKGNKTEIKVNDINLSEYDLIIIGTPVWVGTMAPAIKTYFEDKTHLLKNVAFFSTQGGVKKQRVFNDLKVLCKKDPVSELFLTTKEVKDNNYSGKLDQFIGSLKKK